MYYGKNKQIKNIFKKGLKQKNRIIRNRRERSYDDSIKRFSRDSEVSKQWGRFFLFIRPPYPIEPNKNND